MTDVDLSEKRHWYSINGKLFPVKIVYFLFIAAKGDLLPFIPVYMKQLGLTSMETGLLYGIMPFVSFLVRPVFGAIADKTQRHRVVFSICCLLTGVCYCLLLVVPASHHQSLVHPLPNNTCMPDMFYIKKHLDTKVFSQQVESSNNISDTTKFNGMFCEVHCKLSDISKYHGRRTCFLKEETQKKDNCESNHLVDAIRILSYTNESLINITVLPCEYDRHASTEVRHTSLSSTKCIENAQMTCKSKQNVLDQSEISTEAEGYSKTFWIFLVIFLFCNIFMPSAGSLLDAIAYSVLSEKGTSWGQQRVWGTIGFAMFAVTSTFIMDQISQDKTKINYSFSFYIYLGLKVIACLVVFKVNYPKDIKCTGLLKNMSKIFRNCKIVIFLILVVCIGTINSVIETFLFWYLKDLGSSNITLGLCLVINCTFETIFLFASGYIINRFGHVVCFYIGLGAYAVRFFAYSVLPSAWYVLPVESLHGLTFGLMFPALTSYGNQLVPPGLAATMQGLISGLYYGLGNSIGCVATGQMFNPETGLGEAWSFRTYGIFSIFVLVLHLFTDKLTTCKRRVDKGIEKDDRGQAAEGFLQDV